MVDIDFRNVKEISFEDIQTSCKDEREIAQLFSKLKENGKKIALLFGNCQIKFIEDIILNSPEFSEEYTIIRVRPVFVYNEEEKQAGLNKQLLKATDLFIHQNVYDEVKWGNLVTSNIIRNLNGSCRKVSIPNVYFKGYHPQVISNKRNVMIGSIYNFGGIAPYGDSILDKKFNESISVNELEEYLYSDICISESDINENLNNTFIELKRREEELDISISDYIEENFRTKYLFYTPSHPTNEVLHELVKRILNKIGIKSDFPIPRLEENDRFEVPIYPKVYKTLGCSFEKETYYFCQSLCDHRDTMLGWALKYKYYCYPELEKASNTIINLSDLVEIKDSYLEKRGAVVMTYCGGMVNLSCYLTVKRGIPNLPVITIPKGYAPKYDFIVTGCGSNTMCPVQVCKNGTIKINKAVLDSNVLMLNATWHC